MDDGKTKTVIGGINIPQFRDPVYDQSANMPDVGKGDKNVIEKVAPAPLPDPSPFRNVRTGRK